MDIPGAGAILVYRMPNVPSDSQLSVLNFNFVPYMNHLNSGRNQLHFAYVV